MYKNKKYKCYVKLMTVLMDFESFKTFFFLFFLKKKHKIITETGKQNTHFDLYL